MPHLVVKLQGDLAGLIERINADAEVLLKSLDLKKVLDDPGFINQISLLFIEQHMDEIAEGIRMGEAFAREVISAKERRDAI